MKARSLARSNARQLRSKRIKTMKAMTWHGKHDIRCESATDTEFFARADMLDTSVARQIRKILVLSPGWRGRHRRGVEEQADVGRRPLLKRWPSSFAKCPNLAPQIIRHPAVAPSHRQTTLLPMRLAGFSSVSKLPPEHDKKRFPPPRPWNFCHAHRFVSPDIQNPKGT